MHLVTAAPSEPIKVCFVTLRAYPLFNPAVEKLFGGTEVDFYYLSRELARDERFAVSFIVGDYGQPPVEQRDGVKLIKSLDVEGNFLLQGRRLWNALKLADAQIYVTQGLSLGTALIAWFCRRYRRFQVSRTASTFECDGTYLRHNPARAPAVRWAIRQADALIIQNDYDVEKAKATFGITPMTIRNGQVLPPLEHSTRRGAIWIGRSIEVKRVDRFLDLARQFPDQPFTLICQRASGDSQYDQLVAQANQIPNLEFLPRVKFQEVEDYFLRAAVFVNTSDAEGFPNTFVQACKCSTPILSHTIDPDSFIKNYQCGLCAHADEQTFLDMFKQLLDPTTAQRYGANGRRYAEENHDITRIIEQYKDIFRKLLATQS